MSFCGKESPIWDGRKAQFMVIAHDPDPRVRIVGQRGLQMAEARYEPAIRSERQDQIFGW